MTAGLTQSRRHDLLARLRAAMDAPSGRVAIVNVPMGNFLMVDGVGGADSEAFRCAVRTLTTISAAVRLFLQEGDGALYDPMPLEVLWSIPGDEVWQEASAGDWAWTAMVAQPARVTPELVVAVREREVRLPREAACRVHLGSLREGLCAQIACPGHESNGPKAVERLLGEVRSLGYEPHGPRHEIYLADLRHRDVAALRMIVRQPIRRGR